MRLTTKGRFAVTAMIDLALHQSEGPVTLAGISQRQNISLSYLEQLFGKLRRVQIVSSTRGPGGGYKLCRHQDEITVADIIVAVDEPIDATECGGKGKCHGQNEHFGQCMTHDLWTSLNNTMVSFLESVSLKDLVIAQQNKGIMSANFVPKGKILASQITRRQSAKNLTAAETKLAIKRENRPKEPKPFIVNSVFNLAQQN